MISYHHLEIMDSIGQMYWLNDKEKWEELFKQLSHTIDRSLMLYQAGLE